MTAMADRISIISAERIRDELAKLVLAPYPRLGLTLLVDTGLAALVLPELPALALERDEHHRHKDVYEHTLTVLEQSIDLEDRLGGPDLVSRLAALMHDVGKPRTRRFVGRRLGDLPPPRRGRRQADAQAPAGAAVPRRHGRRGGQAGRAAPALPRLRRRRVDRLRRPPLRARRRRPARAAARADPGRLHDAQRAKADRLRRTYDDLESRIARLSEEEELASIRPDLDGSQIMEILGIPPGPRRRRGLPLPPRPPPRQRPDDRGRPLAAALLAWWASR